MFEYILDCPQCNHRFHYEMEGDFFPEEIDCPECGAFSPSEDYSALILCGECRSKIKVPLDMLNEEGLVCPKCGAGIRPDALASLSGVGTTIADFMPAGEKKRMLQDGAFFDKYRIIRLLGRGGMAEVYLAEHLLLKQKCALKLMQRTLEQSDNPVFVKRFVREAKLTHSLNHSNIVRVFDAGSDFKTGYLFLAMEYVEGRTLHDIICEQELPESSLLDTMTVMAYALKTLEEAKVVHRDIKPSNIMYTAEGTWKLMDLGIAKMESNHQAGDMTLTMEQSTIGTPGYASPEQCSAAHQVDIRSDIFSLGATIYHAASGVMPFDGETPVAVILKTMQGEPEPLKNLRPDLSDSFIKLVEKMMKKNPSERFQTIDELIEALEKIEKNENSSASIRKMRQVVSALTTGFDLVAGKGKKVTGKLVFGILKLIFAVLLVAVAAVHVYYFVSRVQSGTRADYGNFMKSLVVRPSKKGQKSVSEILLALHPMISDPKYSEIFSSKNLYPANFASSNRQVSYPLVRVEKSSYRRFSFDSMGELEKSEGVKIQGGVLKITSKTKASFKVQNSSFSRLPSNGNEVFSLNFRLYSDEDMGLFEFKGVELFVYSGKLHLKYDKFYVNTGVTIPPHRWFPLTVSLAPSEGRIMLLSGNRLIGSYLFSAWGHYVGYFFSFAVPMMNNNKTMQGEVDFLALATVDAPLKFTVIEPLTRAPLQTYAERIPDRLPHEYGSSNSPQDKKAAEAKTAVTAVQKKAEKTPDLPSHKNVSFTPAQSKTTSYVAKTLKFPESSINVAEALKKRLSTLPPDQRMAAREIIAQSQKLREGAKKRAVYLNVRNRRIAETAQKTYDEALGAAVQKKFADYTQRKGDWGYNSTCIKFSEELLADFNNPRLDPNIRLEDKSYSQYSGNAMKAISSGRIVKEEKLYEVLIRRFADPSCLQTATGSRLFSLQLVKYGLPSTLLKTSLDHFFSPRYRGSYDAQVIELLLCDGAIPTADHLAQAVISNCPEIVTLLLAYGVDPNALNKDGETALFNSYRLSDGKKIRNILLAAGADPSITSGSGRKAEDFQKIGRFLAEWQKGAIAEIDSALQAGADPNMLLPNGDTLLHDACRRNNMELVKVLFKHKVDPNRKGTSSYCPLAITVDFVTRGSFQRRLKELERAAEIMKFMVKNGADIRMNPNGYGGASLNIFWRVLQFCKRKNYSNSASRMVEKISRSTALFMVDYTDNFTESHWSSIFVEIPSLPNDISRKILDKIPSDVVQKLHGMLFTPYRIKTVTPELVHALGAKKVDFNQKRGVRIYDSGTKVPLHFFAPTLFIAVRNGASPEVVKALIKCGADVNWRNGEGKTACDIAKTPELKRVLRSGR